FGVEAAQLARQSSQRPAELGRPCQRVAVPEGDLAGLAWSGCDEDLVWGDVRHSPGAGAEHEILARARLEDHLLVQLPDAAAILEQIHGIEPAVWDRAR